MKKYMTTLLIAALAPVLGLAQEKPTTPEPTKAQALAIRITASQSLADVVSLEKEFAANLSVFTPADISFIAVPLWQAYVRCAQRKEVAWGNWPLDVLPRYVPDWNTSTDGAVAIYCNVWVSQSALLAFSDALKTVKTPAELDALVAGYLSKNLLPERLQEKWDSRLVNVGIVMASVSTAATRLGHSEAINYALAKYRLAPMNGEVAVNAAVRDVATAIKAKDSGLSRANVWIEGQNTGVPAVPLTEQEKTLPAALQAVAETLPAYLPVSLEAAKQVYRSAATPAQIDASIYMVAAALKAQDLNLARANAWIKSQKDGTPFDLK
jgi:hypothetical protein